MSNKKQEGDIIAKLKKALENDRLDPTSRANKEDCLLDALFRSGGNVEALEILEKSLTSENPQLRQSRRSRLIGFYRRQGEIKKAITLLEQELNDKDSEQIVRSEARHSMVDVYLEDGNVDRAIVVLEHEINDRTIDSTLRADGQIRLANVLADCDRREEACNILRAAIDSYQDIPWLAEELREELLSLLDGNGSLKEREEIEFVLKDYRRKQDHRREVWAGIDKDLEKVWPKRRRSKSSRRS